MNIITLIGVDPGLVHTGVVAMHFDIVRRVYIVEYAIIRGDDVQSTLEAVEDFRTRTKNNHVYIEKYRGRATNFKENADMIKLEIALHKEIPKAKLIDNTGVKKVITTELMKLLGVWDFPTTNHRDLQAAARIALYGAAKDEELNTLLAGFTLSEVDGDPWLRLS